MAKYTRVQIITDGSTIDASDVENEFNAIKDSVNNIDDEQISSDADIQGSKLKDASIATAKLEDDAVTTDKIASTTIVPDNCNDGVGGWHGDQDRIKILPKDFIGNQQDKPENMASDGSYVQALAGAYLICNVPIPIGYKATAVRIYASGTAPVVIYENDITDNTATSKGTGDTSAEIDITDVIASATNYLSARVTIGWTVFGGYVTIEKV
jgi:hypothetical protein